MIPFKVLPKNSIGTPADRFDSDGEENEEGATKNPDPNPFTIFFVACLIHVYHWLSREGLFELVIGLLQGLAGLVEGLAEESPTDPQAENTNKALKTRDADVSYGSKVK
jgi:hypothetical protein